ncbi:MAG: regulatory protein RecX [Acidobacteriota bacterium]
MPAEELERCYLAAMRILNYRFNSRAELQRKLRMKDFAAEDIECTLDRLTGEKWLDDDRFAAAFVRTRLRKRIGPLRIRHELHAAGVDDESAARALRENTNADAERESLVAVCAKRARILTRRHGPEYLATDEGRNKLTGYLLKHGYDAAEIRSALKEIPVVHD